MSTKIILFVACKLIFMDKHNLIYVQKFNLFAKHFLVYKVRLVPQYFRVIVLFSTLSEVVRSFKRFSSEISTDSFGIGQQHKVYLISQSTWCNIIHKTFMDQE